MQRNIRGGDLITWLNEDIRGIAVERSLLLCRPLQVYLNRCLKNESVVTIYRQLVVGTSPHHSSATQPECEMARANAMASNYGIISGTAGQDAINAYHRMLADFDDDGWSGASLSIDAKLKCCDGILLAMGGTLGNGLSSISTYRSSTFSGLSETMSTGWRMYVDTPSRFWAALLLATSAWVRTSRPCGRQGSWMNGHRAARGSPYVMSWRRCS